MLKVILKDKLLFLVLWNDAVHRRQNNAMNQSAGMGELDSSIANDLIISKDPKHTLFCRESAFVAIYPLFKG